MVFALETVIKLHPLWALLYLDIDMMCIAQALSAAVKCFVTTALSGFLSILIGLILMAVGVRDAQAQCSGKPYKSGNGEWVTNLVPCGNSGGGSSGSYGGGGTNNAAAALGVAGAAFGLLGAIIENAERRQQELEQEQTNQAARARQSARNRYCSQNFEKATSLYKHASLLVSLSRAADFHAETSHKAISFYESAIEHYALCNETSALRHTRDQISRLRDYIAKSEEEQREWERGKDERSARNAIVREQEERQRAERTQEDNSTANLARQEAEEYASRFGNDDNYWRYKNGQASNQTAQTTPDAGMNSLAGLSRTQKLKILGERYDKILKMPDGPQKDAAKKQHHAMLVAVLNADKPGAQAGAAGAGPRTCANVDSKWVCSNDYNDPVFKQSPGVEQK